MKSLLTLLFAIFLCLRCLCQGLQKTQSSINAYGKELKGTWTDGSSDNATFEIKKDSICYVDELSCFKYSLVEDKLKIKFADYLFIGQIKFLKDSLIIMGPDGTTKYWRFKN